jgi:hypothetical protein
MWNKIEINMEQIDSENEINMIKIYNKNEMNVEQEWN